jgi:hypothetical protein
MNGNDTEKKLIIAQFASLGFSQKQNRVQIDRKKIKEKVQNMSCLFNLRKKVRHLMLLTY